jgi:two-component system response regulator YesN
VLSDILIENQKQISRDTLVSFKEMEKQQTVEEICAYGTHVLSDIAKHISADKTGSSHRVILELLSYIGAHYQEDLGLNELADRAKMNPAYLSVLFKSEVGTSYVKYLTELRLRQAKVLLKDGYKVNEVSEMVGYSNYRYFCDIFKKHEGMTPNEYKSKIWGKSTKKVM